MSSGSRITRNVVGTLLTQFLTWAMAAVFTLFLPRYLHDTGMGKLGIVTSIATVIGVLVPLGTSQVIVKELARDPSKEAPLLAAGLTLRGGLGLLALPLAYVVTHVLGYSREMCLLVLVGIPGTVIFIINDAFSTIYQGREQLAGFNRATLLDKVGYGLGVIGLVLLKAPLWMIVAVASVSGLITLSFYAYGLRAVLKTLRLPRWDELRSLAVLSLPFMGVKVFQTLYGQTDAIVLGALATEQEAGWYTVAFRLIGTAMFFPMALIFALLPTLSRRHHEGDTEGFASLARRSLDITFLVGLPIAAVAVCLPKQIITLLYGPGYAPAAPVLAVAGVGMLLYFVTAVLGTLIIAMDRQAVQAKSALVACVFGIPLCALGTYLGHRLWSNAALGAMVTDVLVEVYLGMVYFRALPRSLFQGGMAARLGRYVLAALPMLLGLALCLASPLGLWGVLPCAAVYLLGCLALRCFSLADLRVLSGSLRGQA